MNAEVVVETGWARRRTAISHKIETTALELCVAHGPDNVTVEQIAVACGMSRRTFYRYFETIDDILIAQPMRMLRRSTEALRARPPEEGIRRALVNIGEDIERSDEEVRLIRLGMRIARDNPAAWWRAMGRMQPTVHALYVQIIADRLRARGRDPSPAPALAAVVLAIVGEAGAKQLQDAEAPGKPIDVLERWASPTWLDDALQAVGEILLEKD